MQPLVHVSEAEAVLPEPNPVVERLRQLWRDDLEQARTAGNRELIVRVSRALKLLPSPNTRWVRPSRPARPPVPANPKATIKLLHDLHEQAKPPSRPRRRRAPVVRRPTFKPPKGKGPAQRAPGTRPQ